MSGGAQQAAFLAATSELNAALDQLGHERDARHAAEAERAALRAVVAKKEEVSFVMCETLDAITAASKQQSAEIDALKRERGELLAALKESDGGASFGARWLKDAIDERDKAQAALAARNYEFATAEAELNAADIERGQSILRESDLARERNEARSTSESWRRAYLSWQEWGDRVILMLGKKPRGGLLGDKPARAKIEAAARRSLSAKTGGAK